MSFSCLRLCHFPSALRPYPWFGRFALASGASDAWVDWARSVCKDVELVKKRRLLDLLIFILDPASHELPLLLILSPAQCHLQQIKRPRGPKRQ